jgi:hypothetical protein
MQHRLEQQAFRGPAGNNGRPALAALEHRGARIKPQAALDFVGSMATDAA